MKIVNIFGFTLLYIMLLGVTVDKANERKIVYNFGDSVNNSIEKNYKLQCDILLKENLDTIENYMFFLVLSKSKSAYNSIYLDNGVNTRFNKITLKSNIFFRVSSGIFIPIVTEFDLLFDEEFKVNKIDNSLFLFSGILIQFDNYGNLIQ